MAVVEVLFENLNSWLQAQPENTIDTPYEIQINFVNATPSDIGDSRNVGTLGYILKQNSTKYVDLSNSYLGSISGINDISYSFFECTTLVKAPNLWTGLSTMERTFSGCTSLKEAPFVSNATNIEGCFSNCTSLVSAPVIPSNVTNINECFSGCTSLTTWNQLNMLNENISYDKCFKNCLSLININTNVSTELKNWLDAIYAESTDNFPNDPEECNYNDYVEVPVIDLRLVLYKAGLNTVENPYRLKVTGLTADNIKDNIPYGQQTLYGALYYNQKYDSSTPSSVYRYVDLRPTVIPETVTDMSSKFISLKNIVYAPDMPITTTLMNGTFYGCSEMLNAPAIPNGVTSIDSCFYNCYNMTETPVIPNSVTSMQQTFYGCSKLTEPANVPVGVTNLWKTFAYNGFTTAPLIPDTVVIMTETFYACRQLSSVILPNKVVLISRCFINTALTETPYLPNTVEQMEESFKNCGSLITVTNLPSNVKNMDGCFSLCSKLTTVPNIPNSVTDFAGTFNNCYHLTECPNIPNKVTDIRGTFRGTGITTPPVIPNGVTNMSSTFESCQSLETAPIIPNGVMYMTGTFCGCTSLTIAPTLPDSVIYMGSNQEYNNNGTFQGCTSLIRVPNVPKNVEDIGNCFNGCTSLEEITLFEADLESLIGDASYNNNKAYRCFKNCSSLVKIGLPSEVTESDWHAFRLKFGASTVEGKVYDQTGTAVTIPQTTITKSTLELPIKTDELWFPSGLTDNEIDAIIEKVIQYRYTYWNKEVLDPAEKNFVLWADNPANVKSNLKGMNPVDVVQSGNMNPVTSNAVADKISSLDVSSVGGSGKYISAISETDGKISATATDLGNMVPVDTVTSGNMHSVTSNAVNNILGRMNNNGALSIGLKGTVWLKIGEFPNQGSGFVLELNIENQYTTNGSSAKRLVIIQGTSNNASPVFYIEEKTASTSTLLTTLRIGYNQNWNDSICIYLKYSANATYANPFKITFKYVGSSDFTPAFTLSTQTPTERQQNVEYALHNSGLYINGTKLA